MAHRSTRNGPSGGALPVLHRLLHPRSVAVVGASERAETYSSETLLNLRRLGFEGAVWGVNPRRSSVHGFPCFPSLADLPSAPDAVVVAIPAAGVPAVIEEAGAIGAGGAVVYAAGFAEAGDAALEDALKEAADRHGLPVCGPNCDGLVSLWSRAALWGDALAAPEPGHVALVSQSGNLVVNALATRRGLRLHTAISSGNETVVTTPDWVEHLAREDGVRSIALLVEAEGDGARLCEALAVCADEGVGVAVLKVGASERGAAAAAAHTGAVAGDHRVFRALMRGGGRGVGRRRARAARAGEGARRPRGPAGGTLVPRRGGLAILTCSGGDSGLGADEAARLGLVAAAARAGDRRGAARAAAGRGDGRQPARLHGDDLGRGRDAARPRPHRRRGPGDRSRARLLRPPAGDRRATPPRAGTRSRRASSPAPPCRPCRCWWRRRCRSCSTTPPPGGSRRPACPRSPGCGPGWPWPRRSRRRCPTPPGCARSPRPAVARSAVAGSRSTRRRRCFVRAACPSFADFWH